MNEVLLFHALGDPIRIEMVRRLAGGASYTISSLSSGLKITRQGARKHLQVLADARVVELKKQGRDTNVLLLKDTLDQGRAFIEKLENQWDLRLQKLKQYVEATVSKP